MLRLRKLFNLLPAITLACISGLGVILDHDHDQKFNEANADTSYILYSDNASYSGTNINTTTLNANSNTSTFNQSFSLYYSKVLNGNNEFGQVAISLSTITGTNSLYGDYSCTDVSNSSPIIFTNVSLSTEGGTFQFYLYQLWFERTDSPFSHNAIGYIRYRLIYRGVTFDTSQYSIPVTFIYPSSRGSIVKDNVSFGPNYSYTATDNGLLLFSSTYEPSSSELDYQSGYDAGYNVGYNDGSTIGYNNGYTAGSNEGYNNGYNNGYVEGYDSREQDIIDAYNNGYNAGYDAGFSVDSTAATIFSGILQVGMLPINVLLAIFNFEILGINISAFISAILTVCLTVIVIRTVTGGKNSE